MPLPLRNTFTYGVPDALDGTVVAGARVLVPFRNRTMTGVVLDVHGSEAVPDTRQKLKDVAEVLDVQPAVLPRLVELGHWVANYYLAPVGETFRAMLPPAVKLRAPRTQTIVSWSDAVPAAANAEANDAAKMCPLPRKATPPPPLPPPSPPTKTLTPGVAASRESRVQTALTERGPMPLAQIAKLVGVTRKVVECLVKQGKAAAMGRAALSWKASAVLRPAVSTVPIKNVLQRGSGARALLKSRSWLDAGAFTVGSLHMRHWAAARPKCTCARSPPLWRAAATR